MATERDGAGGVDAGNSSGMTDGRRKLRKATGEGAMWRHVGGRWRAGGGGAAKVHCIPR